MEYPKVLVIANNSFSLTSSNGRALGNLFIGWPKAKLAEFCVSSDGPNFDLCDNYFCVTDLAALKSFLTFRKARAVNLDSFCSGNSSGNSVTAKKTAFKVIVRNLVWMSNIWKGKEFGEWVDSFSPDLILIQNTDSAFMLNIGYDIARRKNIPIAFYNTEGHYFFKTPYTFGGFIDSYLFKIYRMLYTRVFERVFGQSRLVIHCNNLLKDDFDSAFDVPSEVIYISSFLQESKHKFNDKTPVFSYLGDFCNGRIPVLIELAEVLNSIDKQYKLDVYGNANETEKAQLEACEFINYRGFVTYKEVVKTMDETDILFHVESQDPQWYEPLQYGFSAKIADTLTMGKPFIQYSFEHNAGAKYLKSTNAGWFVSDKEDLRKTIIKVLTSQIERDEKKQNAIAISLKNHQAEANRKKFQQLLADVVYNNDKCQS